MSNSSCALLLYVLSTTAFGQVIDRVLIPVLAGQPKSKVAVRSAGDTDKGGRTGTQRSAEERVRFD